MKIVVCKDYDDVSRVMAEKVVEQIRKKPNLVFCLPAGNSPIGMYKYLVQMYKEGKADFSQLRTFDMDEYAGLTPDDSHSFIYFMHQHFLDHVNINMDNVRYPKADGEYEDFPTDTMTGIVTGIVDSQLGLIERGMRVMQQHGFEPTLVLAGGAVSRFAPYLQKEFPNSIIKHNLVLRGLALRANGEFVR